MAALPKLAGQVPKNAAYAALNVPSQPSGWAYNDPTTNVRIIKLTSSTVPIANTAAIPDYFESGPRISHPWGTGTQYTIDIYTPYQLGHYLVDFDLATQKLSNWRAAPPGEAECASGFSLNAATPQVMYKLDTSGVLRRWNVSGSTNQEIVGGNFPKNLSGSLGGRGLWFGFGVPEDWFVVMAKDNSKIVAFQNSTNTTLVRTTVDFPALDEPKVERNGRYVWVRHSTGNTWWDLQTNTLGPYASDGTAHAYRGHGGTPRGHSVGIEGNYTGAQYYTTPTSTMPTLENSSTPISWEVNNAGQWVTQSPADTTQYFVHSGNTDSAHFPGQACDMGVAFLRIDGGDTRLLCHHYGAGSYYGAAGSTAQYYNGFIWGQPSPDGRLVMFKSSMLSTSGRPDTFLALVPLA